MADSKEAKLYYMGRIWLDYYGDFSAEITERGGLDLMHPHFARREDLPPNAYLRVHGEHERIRVYFSSLLPLHLAEDFRHCVVGYVDQAGQILGKISFKHWVVENGRQRKLVVSDEGDLVRVSLPPVFKLRHCVPRGTKHLMFHFAISETNFERKYNANVRVLSDKRTLPNPVLPQGFTGRKIS